MNHTVQNKLIKLGSLFFLLLLNATFGLNQLQAQLPDAYDAREHDLVTPAKAKGECGACSVFASVSAFESRLLKHYPETFDKNTLDLAEQQQIPCNATCSGGGAGQVLQYWSNAGPVYEDCCPYCEYNTIAVSTVPCGRCEACGQLPYRITDIVTINDMVISGTSSEEVKASLYNEGPGVLYLNVCSDLYNDDPAVYDFWHDGTENQVYVCQAGTSGLPHYVSIIGWDDNRGAFLCMNNWGEGGPNGDGTFWIAYSGHDPGCNLGFRMTSFTVVKDSDADGISDDHDNCIADPNGPVKGTCVLGGARFGGMCSSNTQCGPGGSCSMAQEDSDDNGIGDACDEITENDYDSDGFVDGEDNCPYVYNPGQESTDTDTYGDACDYCISVSDPDQYDADGDVIGDVCDDCTDTDGDGYGNPGFLNNTCSMDNCPDDDNPAQENSDGDVLGDSCDNCPEDDNPDQEDRYPPQGNGIGDACDCEGNFDCDEDMDGADAALFKIDFGRTGYSNPCMVDNPCNGDFDCDTDVDGTDAGIFKADFGRNTYNKPCVPNTIQCRNPGSFCCY